jgi:hypothetical protein
MKYTRPTVRNFARTRTAYCSTGSSATDTGGRTDEKFCQSGGNTVDPVEGPGVCVTGTSPYTGWDGTACSDGSAATYPSGAIYTCTNGSSAASGGTSRNNCDTGGDFL